MAVPSNSNINGFIFRSSGLGEAFYDLLTEGSGAYERFMAMCRGGALLKEATKIASNKMVESSDRRDGLRSMVTELIRTKISKSTHQLTLQQPHPLTMGRRTHQQQIWRTSKDTSQEGRPNGRAGETETSLEDTFRLASRPHWAGTAHHIKGSQ